MMTSVISKAMAGNKSQYEGEYLSVTGGIRTPVRARFAPIISDNSEISGAIGIFEDISEQLTAEKEKLKLMARLQQSQKMEAIGTLSGGIAHDFNNILFPIIGYAEILQEDLPQNSPEQKNIIEILHAALRAKDLVKQILAFSRQSDQELKPVRLQSIIKEALKLLKPSIPTTIDFQTDIDPDCGLVVADPSQIHQIIMNLATNAYHAMQESGGQIKVSLKQTEIDSTPLGFSELLPGKYAILKVTDTGKGIKKKWIKSMILISLVRKPAKEPAWDFRLFRGSLKTVTVTSMFIVSLARALNFMFTCQLSKQLQKLVVLIRLSRFKEDQKGFFLWMMKR